MRARDNRKSVGFHLGSFEMAIITLVLIGLKFSVAPGLPWAVALAPIWIPAALVVVILGVPAIIMILGLIACAVFGGACILWDFIREIWKGGRKP